MPRPTKYTIARADAIVRDLRLGCTRRAACDAVGVSYDSFARWLVRFAAFADSVRAAEADAERRMTKCVMKAAVDGDWRAAIEWLKRRRRAEWGDNVSVDLDSEIRTLVAELAGTPQGAAARRTAAARGPGEGGDSTTG